MQSSFYIINLLNKIRKTLDKTNTILKDASGKSSEVQISKVNQSNISDSLHFITTEPLEAYPAIDDQDFGVVILDHVPTTFYAGWMYFITD